MGLIVHLLVQCAAVLVVTQTQHADYTHHQLHPSIPIQPQIFTPFTVHSTIYSTIYSYKIVTSTAIVPLCTNSIERDLTTVLETSTIPNIPQFTSNLPPPCQKPCPEIFLPVCGGTADDQMLQTYTNMCFLEIAICQDPAIEFKHNGTCTCSKPCSNIVLPVCGGTADDRMLQTYTNMCSLEIAICQDPAIEFKHNGPCSCLVQPGPPYGHCEILVHGYSYSVMDSSCESISYVGCGLKSDANFFNTYDECSQTCDRNITDGSIEPICGEGNNGKCVLLGHLCTHPIEAKCANDYFCCDQNTDEEPLYTCGDPFNGCGDGFCLAPGEDCLGELLPWCNCPLGGRCCSNEPSSLS